MLLRSTFDPFDDDLDLPPDKRFDEECFGEPKLRRKLVDRDLFCIQSITKGFIYCLLRELTALIIE
jgi:hypothetical protein